MTGRMPVVECELAADPPVLPDVGTAGGAYLVLRWKGRPVGRIVVEEPERLAAEAFRDELKRTASDAIRFAQTQESRPAGIPPEDASVVVATRDRPEDLHRCLEALARLDPPAGEIVVIDSGSLDPAAVRSAAEDRCDTLLRLDEPGLSKARNAGADGAKRPVVAFLDDDCLADPGWLGALCAGFEDDRIEAVTGGYVPLELETRAQRLFLAYSHMDRRGFVPQRFERDRRESPCWPVDSWRMGSGGNLAVRRGAFLDHGGFRTDLGLGTPAMGGEDLFLLYRTIVRGRAVSFRPDALVAHRHHRDIPSLRRVLYGYGVGHSAYLRAVAGAGESRRRVLRYRASFLADRFKRMGSCLLGRSRFPAWMVWRELAGTLAGPRAAREDRS